MVQPISPLLPPPSKQQQVLALTADYLQHAGLQAATRLLPMQEPASLCQTLTEVFDGWAFLTGR